MIMTKQNQSTNLAKATTLKFFTELLKSCCFVVCRRGAVGLNSRQLKKQNLHHPQ